MLMSRLRTTDGRTEREDRARILKQNSQFFHCFGQSIFGTFPRQAVTPNGLVPIDPPPGPDPSVLKQCSFSADKK